MKLRGLLVFAFVMVLANRSYAAPICPTGTIGSVIALGSCTIGDATFTFGPPALATHPVWDNPPYVGNTVLGPSASAVLFTPVNTPGNPGFNLAADFSVNGGFACRFFGSCGTGNFADVQFGYFGVSAAPGTFLTGEGLELFGANVTQGTSETDPNWNNIALVNMSGGPAVYVTGSGATQLVNSTVFSSPVSSVLGLAFFRTWDRSGDSSSVAEFSSVTFGFGQTLQETSSVPEPASLLLLGSGLIAAKARLRRKRGA